MGEQRVLGFTVTGSVATQGSKNGFPIYSGSKAEGTRTFTGKVALVESDRNLKGWRTAVTFAARSARTSGRFAPASEFPILSPVRVRLFFSVQPPVKVPASRCGWPAVKPDVDKLSRAVLDALTEACVWKDDGQVVALETTKLYNLLDGPGVVVEVIREDSRGEVLARQYAGLYVALSASSKQLDS